MNEHINTRQKATVRLTIKTNESHPLLSYAVDNSTNVGCNNFLQ